MLKAFDAECSTFLDIVSYIGSIYNSPAITSGRAIVALLFRHTPETSTATNWKDITLTDPT